MLCTCSMDCISCAALRVVLTAKFGSGTENAVKKYQGKKGLTQDGIVGDGTWNALVSDIKTIQQLLKNKGYYASTVDGLAGSGTYNAVISFQKASGLTADGMVGSATLNALTLLRAVQVVNLIQSLCLLIELSLGTEEFGDC